MGEGMSRLAYPSVRSNKSLKNLTVASFTLVLSCGVSHHAMAACVVNGVVGGPTTINADTVSCTATNSSGSAGLDLQGGGDTLTYTGGNGGAIIGNTGADTMTFSGGTVAGAFNNVANTFAASVLGGDDIDTISI